MLCLPDEPSAFWWARSEGFWKTKHTARVGWPNLLLWLHLTAAILEGHEHPRWRHCHYLPDLEISWPATCSPVFPARPTFINDLVVLSSGTTGVKLCSINPFLLQDPQSRWSWHWPPNQVTICKFYALPPGTAHSLETNPFGVCSESSSEKSACTVGHKDTKLALLLAHSNHFGKVGIFSQIMFTEVFSGK